MNCLSSLFIFLVLYQSFWLLCELHRILIDQNPHPLSFRMDSLVCLLSLNPNHHLRCPWQRWSTFKYIWVWCQTLWSFSKYFAHSIVQNLLHRKPWCFLSLKGDILSALSKRWGSSLTIVFMSSLRMKNENLAGLHQCHFRALQC